MSYGTKPDLSKWKDFLNEATRAEKEGVKLPNIIDELGQYVSDPAEYYINFSEINKLGINPSSGKNNLGSDTRTPLGIYSYPLNSAIYRQIKNGKIPFASHREYIHLFRPKPSSNVLTNSTKVSESIPYIEKMFSKSFQQKYAKTGSANDLQISGDKELALKDPAKFIKDNIKAKGSTAARAHMQSKQAIEGYQAWMHDFQRFKFSGQFAGPIVWYMTRLMLFRPDPDNPVLVDDPTVWAKAFVNLGIDGFIDNKGEGYIHPSEPMQAVFFTKRSLELIKTFDNKIKPWQTKLEKTGDIRKEMAKFITGLAQGFAQPLPSQALLGIQNKVISILSNDEVKSKEEFDTMWKAVLAAAQSTDKEEIDVLDQIIDNIVGTPDLEQTLRAIYVKFVREMVREYHGKITTISSRNTKFNYEKYAKMMNTKINPSDVLHRFQSAKTPLEINVLIDEYAESFNSVIKAIEEEYNMKFYSMFKKSLREEASPPPTRMGSNTSLSEYEVVNEVAKENIDKLGLYSDANMIILYEPYITRPGIRRGDTQMIQKGLVGVIRLGWSSTNRTYKVEESWAKPGYGPVTYRLAMEYAYNDTQKGLMPSTLQGEVSAKAANVWKQFYDGKGSDFVHKKPAKTTSHEEDYLNTIYYIKKKVSTAHAVANHEHLFSREKDPYGEKLVDLIEAAAMLVRERVGEVYGE